MVQAVTRKVQFKTDYARRLPDPIDQSKTHHFFWIKASELPENLPKDPNPRAQNLNRGVYKEVKESYLNEGVFTPFTFHLKNNGMDLIAQYVNKVSNQNNIYEIGFSDHEGVINGYHTYKIIMDNKEEVPGQYVLLKVTTNIEENFITEMAGGLNTSVQVHDESLLNQKGAFNWIKDTLKPYNQDISYKENVNKKMDIRQLVAIMTLFNIELYPTQSGKTKHPKYGYSSKAKCLELFKNEFNKSKEEDNSYKKLQPILKDIMVLHDYIKYSASKKHNGHARKLDYFKSWETPKDKLVFLDEKSDILLRKAALYPIIATFRIFIKEENGKFQWKNPNGIDDILNIWDRHGSNIMDEIQGIYNELGKSVNTLGKARVTWTSVYSSLLASYFEDRGDLI